MRIHSLDVLRGLAILGILVMNMGFHYNILTGYVHFETRLLSDELIILIQSLFADGRFRSLFCIMFGVGLAIQMRSCERKGHDHRIFLKSRLKWLFIFGVCHAVFIFGGDILMLYSICGYLMIKHLSLPNEEMLAKGKKYFAIGSLLALLTGVILVLTADPENVTHRVSSDYLEFIEFTQGGVINQILAQTGVALFLLIVSPMFILWQSLGLMMIGIYLYRSGFFTHGFSRSTGKKVLWLAIVSTTITAFPQLIDETIDFTTILAFSSVSAIFVALVYADWIIKVSQRENWFTNTLSACGKLAFTLYISQSIIMAVLFRLLIPLFNPELSAQITQIELMIIAAVIILFQMLFANWYLSRFESGPLEKLWRKLYLKSFQKKSETLLESRDK